MRALFFALCFITAVIAGASTVSVPDITTATRIITRDLLNTDRSALRTDFVPRDTAGVATTAAGGLGTSSLSWGPSYIEKIIFGTTGSTPFIQESGSNDLILDTGDASGSIELKINGVTKATIDTNGISRSSLVEVGEQISTKADFSTASTSFVDVTNLSVTITTSGRPVVLALICDDATLFCSTRIDSGSGRLQFLRSGAAISGELGISTPIIPSTSYSHFDVVSAGTYTYKVQVKSISGGSDIIRISHTKLIAYEL